jgi:hypothetical protein
LQTCIKYGGKLQPNKVLVPERKKKQWSLRRKLVLQSKSSISRKLLCRIFEGDRHKVVIYCLLTYNVRVLHHWWHFILFLYAGVLNAFLYYYYYY